MKSSHLLNELVINWHITEACNYSCRYCYAHWCKNKQRELLHNPNQADALLQALSQYFTTNINDNSLQNKLNYSSVRLNIAGGEPLLYPQQVMGIVDTALSFGMHTSIITNGSLLNHELMSFLAPRLSVLGISVDSLSSGINKSIGRVDNKNVLLNTDTLVALTQLSRKLNPELRIKMNTVVNSKNWDDDLTTLLNEVKPERWKVLRMLPVVNGDLAINSDQFRSFANRHTEHQEIMSIEDNDEMEESYLMIDPLGRFFQNTPNSSGRGYVYSDPILAVGVEPALKSINFSIDKYLRRYEEAGR